MSSLVVLLTLLLNVLADDDKLFTQKIEDGFEKVKEQTGITNQTNLTSWNVEPVGLEFPCEHFSWPRTLPTNDLFILITDNTVNKVMPYHIDIVGALGDSITAAQGAKASTIFTATKQYRGVSFSAGGDGDLSTVTTLPNIIKQYNPNVKGYSVGAGVETSSGSKLNCAVSGATSKDLYKQSIELVYRIKSDSKNMDNELDWKIVSIFIGSNDLCSSCNNEGHSANDYVNNVKLGLDYLYQNLPRTIVNLILPIDVTHLEPVTGFICNVIHWYACDCISSSNKDETSNLSTAYQKGVGQLIESNRYEKDDFTVVIQPFFIDVVLPYKNGRPDKSYFAPDCFHFSTKSQAETAKALWNNMLQPVGNKDTGWQIGGDIICPTQEHPYFYTRNNSIIDALSGNLLSNYTEGSYTNNSHVGIIIACSTIGTVAMAILIMVGVIVAVANALRKRNNKIEQTSLLGKQIL